MMTATSTTLAVGDDTPCPSGDGWRSRKQRFMLANSAEIACLTLGKQDAPVVLFIHGFTDSSRSWSRFIKHFDDFRLIIPDLRGHGDSSAPDYGYSLAHFADDLRLLLDALGVRSAIVVGHSLGGMIAQLFAASFPERVERLVLIGTTGSPYLVAGPDFRAAIDVLQWPLDPDGDFMMRWYSNAGQVDPAFLQALKQDASQVPLRVLQQIARQTAITRLAPLAEEIKAETLVIWGDHDPFFGLEEQRELVANISGSRLEIMSGAGHNPFWEEADQTAEIINHFIQANG